MKQLLLIMFTFAALISASNASEDPSQLIAQPKIVGGELASEGDWPWMSTLVHSYTGIDTYLSFNNNEYESEPFANSPMGEVIAEVVDCGLGDNLCPTAQDKICLMSRGDINFSVKVNNCELSGGIAAIIYNNASGMVNGTLGNNFTGDIPVLAVSQSSGSIILNQINLAAEQTNTATIKVSIEETFVQTAVCGATFIGDKWLITAAHCVIDTDIDLLKVDIGEYDLSSNDNDTKNIKQVFIHPDYDINAAFDSDIALLELTESFDHPSISLIDAATSKQLAIDNSISTVIGWGNRTAYGPAEAPPSNDQPDILHETDVYLMSNEECKTQLSQAYSDLNNQTYTPEDTGITDNMICTDFPGGGSGSCQGDSGGPLVVNTNLGWQQIGLVSYGLGCGDADFPDVYTRVGEFTPWINNITQGVAIQSSHDFSVVPHNIVKSTFLTVDNNSSEGANLTFSVSSMTEHSSGITLNSDDCSFLAASESCQLQVIFDAKTIGVHQSQITINSSNTNIPTSQSIVSAQVLPVNDDIKTHLLLDDTEQRWYSGGDSSWILSNWGAEIASGNISSDEESAVMLTFSGRGNLTFEWAVSSEENTETFAEPYDALYLFVDDIEYDYISGEVDYASVTIDFNSDDEHSVVWLYKKDYADSAGDDQGYLRNVVFTPSVVSPTDVTIPTTEPSTTPTTPSSEPTTTPVVVDINEPSSSTTDETPSTDSASNNVATDSKSGSFYYLIILLALSLVRSLIQSHKSVRAA